MRPARLRAVSAPDSVSARATAKRPPAQRSSIAKDDWPPERSLLFILSRHFANGFFGLAYIFQRHFAGFNQVRHDRLNASAKEPQQFVDQAFLGGAARYDGLEDVGVADLLRTPQCLLVLQPVNGCLDCCVSRPSF